MLHDNGHTVWFKFDLCLAGKSDLGHMVLFKFDMCLAGKILHSNNNHIRNMSVCMGRNYPPKMFFSSAT